MTTISSGGNRGRDDQFMQHAPPGQYRVVGVDTFDGTDWVAGDFPTLASVQGFLARHTKKVGMLKMYIYDDQGRLQGEGSTF